MTVEDDRIPHANTTQDIIVQATQEVADYAPASELPMEPVFDGRVAVYLDPDIKEHYEPQEEKLQYYIWLARTVQFLTDHRTSPHRLWFQVGGIGLGNELQVTAVQIAEHEQDDRFGVMGVDYVPQVIENVQTRAANEDWVTALAQADLTQPHTYWEQFIDPEYPQSRPVILTALSSMLHEARERDTAVLQHALEYSADGAGIFIREFEPTRPGRVRIRLKSPDARRFYAHFREFWNFHEGEDIFTDVDYTRWKTTDGSLDDQESEVETTERLGREFWLHYRNWRKNVTALGKSGKKGDPYRQIHKWPELQEGYVNHRYTTNGIAQFAHNLIRELYIPDTHTIIPFARTMSDTSDDEHTNITDHIELLEQDDQTKWIATPRLNETRRMWIYLHYVPRGRENEFPCPIPLDEALHPLAE